MKTGYVYRTIINPANPKSRTSVLMHRIIMSAAKGEEIDHINRNKLDNRKQNLRFVEHWVNGHNRCKGTGVHMMKSRNKWVAKIYIKNKYHFLGSFNTEEEAKEARLQAELKFGLLMTPCATDINQRSGEALQRRSQYRHSIGRKTVPPGNLAEQLTAMAQGASPKDMCGLLITPTAVQHCESPEAVRARAERNGYRCGTRYNTLTSQIVYGEMLPTPSAGEGYNYNKTYNPDSQMGKGLTAMAVNGMLPEPVPEPREDGTPVIPGDTVMLGTPTATAAIRSEKYRGDTRIPNPAEYAQMAARGEVRIASRQEIERFNLQKQMPGFYLRMHGRMWPTPTASCRNAGTTKDMKDGTPRTELNHLVSREAGKSSQLNPLFVSEMMGLPMDWLVSPFQNGETSP